jgi:RND superfamily putative drug exporter
MAILGERAWEIPAWLERILPKVDIEGEAVERERHLASWPGDDAVVAADDLDIEADAPLLERLSLRLSPGGALIATGGSAGARRALALTVAGRIAPSDGRLRVAGHLLPGRAAWVRAHVGCVLVDDAETALADLAEALRGRSSLVVIDGIDRLAGPHRDQATAMLRDAAARRPLAVLATAADTGTARSTLADAGWASPDELDTRAPHRRAAESTEVTA